jgi:EmrB/QacA subfamily drug resistance transporter
MSSTTSSIDAARGSAASTPRSPGLLLACLCTCTLLVVGLVAAINLAVPTIAASSLHPGASDLLWIVDSYVVVFAGLVIPGGAAGDRFGRKGALITGLGLFTLGAAVSAAAVSVPLLLTGRVLTGIGAALILPNCVGLLVHATTPARRGRALAVWATATGLGGLVGNLGGGALLSASSWRVLFIAVAALAGLCAAWVAYLAPRSPRHARTLDLPGTVLFVLAIVALLVGIIEGPEKGWAGLTVLAAFASSLVLSAAWVVVELRSHEPLLDPRLFRIPALTGASLGMLVTFFGSFGLFYVNASVLQYVRGYSVLLAGVAILPLALPLLIAVRLTPKLAARIGLTTTLAAAFIAISAGLLGLSTAITRPYPLYAAWLVVIGIGFALALPPLTTELTTALPPERAGLAGGLQSATRELGSALGVAVVGTVLTATFTHHLPALLRNGDPIPHTVPEALTRAADQHTAIVHAFAEGAQNALQVAGFVTIAAGVLVIAGAVRGARGASGLVTAEAD